MTLTAPSNILLDSSNSITSALHDQESKRVVKMKSLPQMTLMAGWKEFCLHDLQGWNASNFILGWNIVWMENSYWV